MKSMKNDFTVSTAEASKILGISPWSVRKLWRDGVLPGRKLGQRGQPLRLSRRFLEHAQLLELPATVIAQLQRKGMLA